MYISMTRGRLIVPWIECTQVKRSCKVLKGTLARCLRTYVEIDPENRYPRTGEMHLWL